MTRQSGCFYPSTFVYNSRFFPKIEFFYCLQENAFPTRFLALSIRCSSLINTCEFYGHLVMFSLKLLLLKKKLYDSFLWMGFNFLFKATLRGDSLLFNTRSLWLPGVDLTEGRMAVLTLAWSHPTVLNPRPLNWESSILTTTSLLV